MVSPLAALLLLIVAGKAVSQLTSDQKQMLLDLHNEARRDVLPTAANMQEMVRIVTVDMCMHACMQGQQIKTVASYILAIIVALLKIH